MYKSKIKVKKMISRYLKMSVLSAVVVGLVSCNKGMDNSEEEQKIVENEQAIEKYIADSSLSVTRDSQGFYYSTVTSNPIGTKAAVGEEVTVRYNMYLLDGTRIWTSERDTVKSSKFPFYTGFRFVLPGMELALNTMRTGEKIKLLVPFYLGFGNYTNVLTGYSTNATIPTYSPVRIDMEFVGKRTEIEQINEYIAAKKLTVSERTSDNLVIVKTTPVTTGDTLGSNKAVKIKYVGKLLDGTVFDPGTNPLEFTTGTGRNNLITGFDRGIRRLKTGEKATLILPSAIAYAKNGVVNSAQTNFSIRPYQPIVFEVEVL
ncbi:FKBP-type peptidyl-prolyl cis-trans isomerase [Dyadobacter psychrotolerans]|uniref:Peptidyl-prolyl cis-trans isomerase n=1 Tax=Dyadobacter psychrotolerans TaxID=2541721 RepID=A0A4R5DF81_9BACT|nr:FKBP-type peptidyl-prolyl cis-trans isomerase [Dyadobacter psychrotolerans]TDE12429.1 FKBP-type peptidyl-prolyl cis-trans isomerase [Dyadobacter psychrotolerans]